jgi:hypothetical protein
LGMLGHSNSNSTPAGIRSDMSAAVVHCPRRAHV